MIWTREIWEYIFKIRSLLCMGLYGKAHAGPNDPFYTWSAPLTQLKIDIFNKTNLLLYWLFGPHSFIKCVKIFISEQGLDYMSPSYMYVTVIEGIQLSYIMP